MPFGSSGFAIRRVFAATREDTWREWTEPDRFAAWFGGAGCRVPRSSVSMNVRPGGSWRATVLCRACRTATHWAGEYREVLAPELLVFTVTDQADQDRHDLVTVLFADLGGGRTEMRFQQNRHPRPRVQTPNRHLLHPK
jgi:uncharacterized protein YndB with AHSA1/START domain